jgi:protein-disulfide isomerase
VLHPLDHVKGRLPEAGGATSTVVLMEYSDFQCPACRSYYPVVREIMQEFGDQITFAYRHFPLSGIHANAEFAARAAEAAHKQGKFWEMHDLLFEKQNEWANVADVLPIFESYADLLGLSKTQFMADFVSKEVKDFVRAERTHALTSGLQGTPSFFLNGKQIPNPGSVEEFKNVIREAINQK